METFLGAGLPPRTLWRNLESSVTQSTDRLNSFFTSSSGSHRPPVSPSVGNFQPNPGDGFSFSNTNMSKVLKSILGIGSDSVGLDEIPLKFLKLFIHVVLPFITYIFNSAITSGTFPAAWKVSRVVPIAKIFDPLEPNDYRPVSILPALSKALEIVMRDQIVAYIESTRALNPFQSSFRSGHSTVTALLNITDDIYRLLD
jgi:hypothetical protein